MWRRALASLAFAAALVPPAGAQSLDPGCRALSGYGPEVPPPVLARGIRNCIAEARFAEAVEVFVGFNSHLLFDQQRVRDVTAHVAVQDLNRIALEGLKPEERAAMRAILERFGDPGDPVHVSICAAVAERGTPGYVPLYMIGRGANPLKSEDDWRTPGFDPQAAWRRALVEINGCAGRG